MFKKYDEKVLRRVQNEELSILKEFDRVCEKHGIRYFLDGGTLIGAVRHKGFIPWDDDLDVGMTREDYERFKEIMPQELGKDYILATPTTHKGYCGAVIKLMRKGTRFVPEFSVEMKCELMMYIDIFVWDNLSDKKLAAWFQMKKARVLSQLLFLCGSSRPEIPYCGMKKTIAMGICKSVHFVLCRIPKIEQGLWRSFEKVSQRENKKNTKYVTCFQTVDIRRHMFRKKDLFPCIRMPFEDFHASAPHNYEQSLRQVYGDYMTLPPEEKRVNHCAAVIDFGGGQNLPNKK